MVTRFWRRPVCHAVLGEAGPAREAQHHDPEIVNAIKQQNTVNPAGQIGGEPAPRQEFTYAIRAQGRLETEEEFGKIVLRANTDGSLVRLKDVARIGTRIPDLCHVGPN